ncbi:EAL domain-containing protein [Sulfurimonas sp.]|uniref:EAL domain-containing protein n=1 Tax=Sulfurimonas sp. TaxID=2022749 RepID=UPI0035645C86
MMRRFTGTKFKLLLFMSIALFILMLITLINIYMNENSDLIREEKIYREKTITAYKNTIENIEILYKSRLEGIVNSPHILEAVKNKDRKKLYKLVKERWDLLKKENESVAIMHFHKPDGYTLLRMHNPSLYDDNIAAKREMCRYMHENKKPISAYEAGIHLLGHRIMIPIFYSSEYIGAVEIGIKPNYILNKMKKNYNVSGIIFAKEEEILNKKYAAKGNLLIGRYRLNTSTLDDKELIQHLPKDYKLETDTRIERDGKIFDIYLFDHKDFKGDVSAKVLIFNDVTFLTQHFQTTILKVILLLVSIYIVAVLIVKYGFEKILNKMDKTNKELQNNFAVLKSHQNAMDESSIVSKSDLSGRITYVNDKFCEITGFTREEIIGKPHSIVRHPDNPKELFRDLWTTIKSKKTWKGILKNRAKNGDYWVDISILPILDDDGSIVEYIAVRHDITQMVLQQKKLDNIANTDSLTGLGSRYKLIQDLNDSKKPALAILNVDSFSEVNDFYGHEKGDYVIIQLSSLLNSIVENTDFLVYHLQGDEFVIFSKYTDRKTFIENVSDIAKKISKNPVVIDEEELYLNLSTAISFEDKQKILSTADMALKVAKKKNKSFVVYNDDISLNDEYKNNINWTKKIKKAIETDNIVPVFQPIVNNETGEYEKYESLVRLKDEEGKLISPFFFLEISKKTKHYNKITQIMIQKSFDKFKDENHEFSINLTIEDILDQQINDYIINMLERYKIGKRVVFEIVESESIEKFEQVHSFIERVKSYNCKIAIDDFGTGYSNFEYLLKLNADYIKIDGSMIKDIDKSKEAEIVVSTIVGFAKKMGIKTIAEFVENESILNKVKEMGIDYSQGYHFSAPKLDI